MQRLLPTLAILLLLSFFSCQKSPVEVHSGLDTSHLDVKKVLNLPLRSFDYQANIPAYLKALGMKAPDIDNHKVTLGRVLFYDKSLSRDEKVSCASCHRPELAFADPDKLSNGVNGSVTSRNSPGLATVAHVGAHYANLNHFSAPFFWDLRASSIAEQSRQTFMNPHEMDMDFATLLQRVQEKPYYKVLFGSTYQDEPIDEEKVLECLEHFVSSISATNTRFDVGMNQNANLHNNGDLIMDTLVITDTLVINLYYQIDTVFPIVNTTIIPQLFIPGLNQEERHGGAIFVANCSSCHSPIRPFQQVFSANIGLDLNYADQGVGAFSGKQADMGVFKAPPLRNIALTQPYMHDGRFASLGQVVEFYSTGIKPHSNLHPMLKKSNGQPQKFNFTQTEKNALIAFLHTLTDNSYANDQRYNNPFK